MNKKPTIATVTAWPLRASLLQPFRIATGEHDHLENVFLCIELADGTKGYGEAAVATHITGETVEGTLQHLRDIASSLIGQSAADYLKISTQLHEALADNHCALAAVEMALLDALTRYFKIPLWRLWGDRQKKLSSDVTIVIADLAETREKATFFYAQGFRSFKIKIGLDQDLDVKRIAAVDKITRHSPLVLDANQGYTASQTIQFLKDLKRIGIVPALMEQPVPKNDSEGLKKITRSTKVCVCADESASTLPQVIDLIKKKAVGAINIKLMKTGLIHGLEIARWTKAHGMKLMIGGMVESNLAMTAAAHMATALGCFDFIDLDTPFFIQGEVARNPFLSTKGVYDLSKVKAGIGIIKKVEML